MQGVCQTKPKFGETKSFRQVYGVPPVGSFSLEAEPPKNPHWDHCREQFANKFTEDMLGFYFSHHPGKSEDVAAFLTKCELIIGIDSFQKPYELSLFKKTERDTILWIEPSRFWMSCPMKRSLLTAFLRCGLNYNSQADNFDDALFSLEFKENKHVRDTKSAVLRFLFGFTRFTGRINQQTPYSIGKHGWVAEFEKDDNSNVRKKLARPDGEVGEPSIIGLDSLWA